ncbi:TPA: hypothetical protein SGG11_002515 [Staphylococcus aureus]|nr:hypothetical protein [Staphylococcus aureus MRSA-Lux-28]HEH1075802.1 hypothetical protein [Staphylococcus aureus]HEI1339770.1 hypothetical protein [Staphylococcus aureus]HEI1340051.1 hypothetical protein [Staphylococcus aureus]
MNFNFMPVLGDLSNMGNPGLDPANTEQLNNHVANSSKLSDKDILQIFHDYGGNLEITNIVTSMFRTLGWAFVRFLVWITDLVSNLAINVLTMFGLLTQDSITKLLVAAQPLLIGILALSILYIGFKMMTGRQVNKANIFTAIVVAMIYLGSLNSTMQTGSELAQESSKAVENFDPDSNKQSDNGTKAGSSLLTKNIVDIKYMAEKNFPKLKSTRNNSDYNKLTATTSKYIDINEGITGDDVKGKDAKKVLGKKVFVNENGKTELKKLKKGAFGIGKEKYYRFQVKWFTAIVGLICLALGHFLAALAVAKIILELIVTKIISVGLAYALQGEKLKSTIIDIINGFVSIVLIFVCLFIFKEVVGFLNDKPLGVWFIGLVAATMFMIDGPKVIERKFGYDAGLSSPWRTALAMYGATKTGASVAGSGVSAASNKIKQTHSNSNKTNSNSSEKANSESNSRSEALNKQAQNSNSNQESNSTTNGERNMNEQQNATSNVGNDLNTKTNQETQEQQNAESKNVDNQQSSNSSSNNTHQTLDQEMKESGYGTNTFKGVGESHSQLWGNTSNTNRNSGSLMSEENLQNLEKQISSGSSSNVSTDNKPTSTENISSGGGTTKNTPTNVESLHGTPQNTPKQSNGFDSGKEQQSTINKASNNTNKTPYSNTRSNNQGKYDKPKNPMNVAKNSQQHRTPSQKSNLNKNNGYSNQIKQSSGNQQVKSSSGASKSYRSTNSNVGKAVKQPREFKTIKSSNNVGKTPKQNNVKNAVRNSNQRKVRPKR